MKVLLLLISKHCDVGCRTSNVCWLAIPNHCWRLILQLFWLLTKKVWSLVRKPSKILRNFFSRSQGILVLSFHALLFLLLPFAVHYTNLKMVPPFRFQNILLAIWTLLNIGLRLVVVLGLADIVLLDFHFWVQCLVWVCHYNLWLSFRLILVQKILIFLDLLLQSLLFFAEVVFYSL